MTLSVAICLLGAITLAGFFYTKKDGFGKYATSTLLLMLIVIISSLMFAEDKLDGQILANVFFSVIGFVGGLFAGQGGNEKSQKNHTKTQ